MKMRKTTAHRERSFLIMSVIMLVAALIGKVCGNVLLEDFSLKKVRISSVQRDRDHKQRSAHFIFGGRKFI